MAITRTAKGTAQAKSGTTLTISNVSLTAGSLLIVGLGYETAGGNPTSVTWGRDMKIVANTTDTRGDTRCRLYRLVAKNTATRDIVATWATAPTAQAMFATEIMEAAKLDISVATNLAGTTAPDTGSAGTSTVADTISIGCFVTGGPSGDTAGTVGSGHTSGQRVGTTGGAAGANVTVHETFEVLAATGTIQASKTGQTSRITACTVAAFAARQTYTLNRIEEPQFRSGVYKHESLFVFRNEASQDVEVVRVPVNLFDKLTDTELLEFCTLHLVQIEDLADGETDVAVDAVPAARVTSLVGSTVVV